MCLSLCHVPCLDYARVCCIALCMCGLSQQMAFSNKAGSQGLPLQVARQGQATDAPVAPPLVGVMVPLSWETAPWL